MSILHHRAPCEQRSLSTGQKHCAEAAGGCAPRTPAFSCLLWKKFYIGFLHFRALSSVGQSGGLIIRWSQVQVLQGPLHSFLRQISILFSRLLCHQVFILALPQIVWADFSMGTRTATFMSRGTILFMALNQIVWVGKPPFCKSGRC